MSDNNASIEAKLADIQGSYEAYFAGQPRMSRNAGILDEMVAELDGLHTTDAGLKQRIADARALYQREAEAIREAQAQGPDAHAAHRLSAWANLIFARYRHHFAGHSRSTRDLGLMTEMIADLTDLKDQLLALKGQFSNGELESTLETLEQNLALYHGERRAIAEARGNGALQEQADLLAQLANNQFGIYADHFAGKSRLSRRPMLLDRVIENLKSIRERMQALKAQGLVSSSNDGNIEVVNGRIKAYEQEMAAVQQARAGTDFPSLINALGQAANAVFEEYREHFAGKDRATREQPRMVKLLDQLWDIARQMDDLDQVRHDETNHRNLDIVLDHVRMYDREFGFIRELQSDTASA